MAVGFTALVRTAVWVALDLTQPHRGRVTVRKEQLESLADFQLDPLLLLTNAVLGVPSIASRAPEERLCPFDGERDGFVPGEGAGMPVLEELAHTRKRGVSVNAEVSGLGRLRRRRRDQARTVRPPDSRPGAVP